MPKYLSDVYKLFILNKTFYIMNNIFNGFFIFIYFNMYYTH